MYVQIVCRFCYKQTPPYNSCVKIAIKQWDLKCWFELFLIYHLPYLVPGRSLSVVIESSLPLSLILTWTVHLQNRYLFMCEKLQRIKKIQIKRSKLHQMRFYRRAKFVHVIWKAMLQLSLSALVCAKPVITYDFILIYLCSEHHACQCLRYWNFFPTIIIWFHH